MALINATNAREMSAKANQVRWSRYRREHADREDETRNGIIPEISPNAADNLSPARESPIDPYIADQLSLVRGQISRLHDVLREASKGLNAKDAKAAADALSRLYDVERVLAGRPLPGTRKPSPERKARPVVEPWKDASAA